MVTKENYSDFVELQRDLEETKTKLKQAISIAVDALNTDDMTYEDMAHIFRHALSDISRIVI